MSKQITPLAKYRIEVLGMKQSEVAEKAGCQQAWISQVERGHLPKPWERDALLKAYGLQKRESYFVKLVTDAKKMQALQKPVLETEPLLAASNARVVKAVLNEGWEDLSASEITLLATYRQMKAKQA